MRPRVWRSYFCWSFAFSKFYNITIHAYTSQEAVGLSPPVCCLMPHVCGSKDLSPASSCRVAGWDQGSHKDRCCPMPPSGDRGGTCTMCCSGFKTLLLASVSKVGPVRQCTSSRYTQWVGSYHIHRPTCVPEAKHGPVPTAVLMQLTEQDLCL